MPVSWRLLLRAITAQVTPVAGGGQTEATLFPLGTKNSAARPWAGPAEIHRSHVTRPREGRPQTPWPPSRGLSHVQTPSLPCLFPRFPPKKAASGSMQPEIPTSSFSWSALGCLSLKQPELLRQQLPAALHSPLGACSSAQNRSLLSLFSIFPMLGTSSTHDDQVRSLPSGAHGVAVAAQTMPMASQQLPLSASCVPVAMPERSPIFNLTSLQGKHFIPHCTDESTEELESYSIFPRTHREQVQS